MEHRFLIMVHGRIMHYEHFDDIPQVIDHVIEFRPHVPPPPHSAEQHREIDRWPLLLEQLMERERASSSS